MKKAILILSVLTAQFFFSQKVKSLTIKEAKTTEQKLELSKEKKELFNGKFMQFISALKASDRKGMDALLSDKSRQVVTDKVYKKLSEDIDPNKKLEIFKTGYKSLVNGGNFPMIQYKYVDDKSQDPKEIITAVFEEDGKILGIKPYKAGK
ncbi:peptidylprolyl isomerase [Chryseobacterium polytrichastri]|uniref:Uncharacterized protein n=1 Tax=Chryseobacterium polytrichastri TaxID=1302687 RepID=A0A1M7I512_9FLAO|nr:peptidylprolyl isomerase [Chryseobacterium polytrichastri]SHM35497.1 hypothetical protein SAMN05444267_10448 [Chryseobacterium polytrichastri]